MKKGILLFATIAVFASCKKENILKVGDPVEKVIQLYGNPDFRSFHTGGFYSEIWYHYESKGVVIHTGNDVVVNIKYN